LAKAGLFSPYIQEGIQTIIDFVEKTTGEKPTHGEIAQSLKSTFILSEIKNQIDWQRKSKTKLIGNEKTPKKPSKRRWPHDLTPQYFFNYLKIQNNF
jgi:hypothetical protein